MFAAISTTILSRRSCALTGSAITSRRRRSNTRGPPSAPRMAAAPSGLVLAEALPVPRRPFSKEESAQVPARSVQPPAYIECGMQTASQRQSYDGGKYCAPQREPVLLATPGLVFCLGFIEAVQRVQGAHCELGKRRVNQQRKLDLGRGDGADVD